MHASVRRSVTIHGLVDLASGLAWFPSRMHLRIMWTRDSGSRTPWGSFSLQARTKWLPRGTDKLFTFAVLARCDAGLGFVKGECRKAALVPPQAGDGLGGQILALVLSKVTFAPKGMQEGDSPEDLLARADSLLAVGISSMWWLGWRRWAFRDLSARSEVVHFRALCSTHLVRTLS